MLTVAAALPPAVLWTLALFGRTAIDGLSIRWAVACIAGWAALSLWCDRAEGGDSRAEWIGLLPAALLSAAAVGVLYASPEAYHAWVFTPRPKGLLLPASLVLALAAPGIGAALTGGDTREWVHRWWRWLLVALLGAFAAAHALSYSQVATDDLIRYWAIADAWAAGAPYAVAEGDPTARQFYLVDVPVYPALVSAAFGLLGHRYVALHAPLVVANLALPFLLYGAARAGGGARLVATGIALTIVGLPMAQVYAFGSAEPDPLWAALLAALAWLGTRLARRDGAERPLREWLALGAVAALLVLTRPEGLLYAGPLALGLAWHHRGAFGRPLAAAITAGLPVLAFSGFLVWSLGIIWPTGFGNVASPRYTPRNVELVIEQNLPHYAASMGLPAPEVMGPIGALSLVVWVAVGAVVLWRRAPGLRLYLLPPALNLVVILVSPTDLAADHFSPPTFFRHWAIALPWLAPALAAGLSVLRHRWAAGAALTALFVWESVILLALPLGPERSRPPILTSDPYVLLSDMGRADAPLPRLPFVDGPGRAVAIHPAFAYLPFRQRLFDAVRPYNLHALDAGRAHVLAGLVFGAVLMVLAALASGTARDEPRGPALCATSPSGCAFTRPTTGAGARPPAGRARFRARPLRARE